VLLREVAISNWLSEPLNGVLISVPSGVGQAQFSCAQPLEIVEIPGAAGGTSRRFRLSGVAPTSIARVLVAVPPGASQDSLSVVNAGFLRLAAGDEVSAGWWPGGGMALVAVLNGLSLGFSFYGLGRVKRDLSEARRAVESQKSKIDAALADVDFQMRRAREEHLRIRLLSVARISDYRRELEFWRDTVRRVLYARSESRADREGFLRGVTDALKTHLTNRSSDRRDFDEVVIMAEVIAGGVARRARTREVGDEPARDDLARDEVPREVPVPPPTRDSTLGD
jgi:hypothetical protein